MTGLATLLASPALVHGLKGSLHNLGLLTELLQKETARQTDAATLQATALRRAEMLRTEIHAVHRQVQLVEALTFDDAENEGGICDVRESLEELLPTTRLEAARHRVDIRLEVDPEVERIQCAPRAFQQLVLAFVTQAVRHCSERATVTVTVVRDGASTRIELRCDTPFASEVHALDRKLLRLLAVRLGARVSEAPMIRLVFESAP